MQNLYYCLKTFAAKLLGTSTRLRIPALLLAVHPKGDAGFLPGASGFPHNGEKSIFAKKIQLTIVFAGDHGAGGAWRAQGAAQAALFGV